MSPNLVHDHCQRETLGQGPPPVALQALPAPPAGRARRENSIDHFRENLAVHLHRRIPGEVISKFIRAKTVSKKNVTIGIIGTHPQVVLLTGTRTNAWATNDAKDIDVNLRADEARTSAISVQDLVVDLAQEAVLVPTYAIVPDLQLDALVRQGDLIGVGHLISIIFVDVET